MAQFRATPSDFDEVIRHRQWSSLRRQGPYPLGALLVAVALLFVHQPSALIAFGMCLAWGISTLLDCRSIRAASLWQHAWAQEDVRIDLEDEGLRLRNARGSGFIRWDSGALVRLYSSCFVVEEFGEEIAVNRSGIWTRPNCLSFRTGPTSMHQRLTGRCSRRAARVSRADSDARTPFAAERQVVRRHLS
jgi:hypothetical protein